MSDLPKGWSKVPISKIGEIITGNTPPTKEREIFYGGKIPFVKPPDLEAGDLLVSANETLSDIGATQGRLLPPYSILVGCIGNIGKVAFSQIACCTNQQINSIIPNQSIAESKYIYWYVLSPNFQELLQANSSATTVAIINKGRFSNLKILLPPLAEQKRIVTKLDSLFAHTRRARQELDHIPKLIERYKQAILSAAFRGDLTADWRKENNQIINAKKFLIDSGIMPCKDVELSPLPDTWIWALTGDLCNIKSGVALGKKRSLGTELIELPYLRVANVQKGWLNLSEIKTILVTQKEAELLYLQSGDILMNEGGDRDKLGRGHVWNGQIENCIHQNHVFRLRLKSQKISPFYMLVKLI